MYKDLLVHIDASKQGERRVDAALRFAELAGARLNGLYVVPPPPTAMYAADIGPAASTLAGSGLYASTMEPLEEQREETRKTIATRTAGSQAEFRWLDSVGPVAAVIGAYARCNDLVIVGQEPDEPEAGHPVPLPSPGAIVFETGRPVLVVPEDGSCDLPGGHALVAWNATLEATRVLHDALPLLARCDAVTVQTYLDPDVEDSDVVEGYDIADHLKRHGVDATWSRDSTDGDVGAALLGKARELGCSMLVLGAYGHSRLREYVFGGVTRHLLGNASMPLFIAH